MIPEKTFAGLLIMTIFDLLQLPPVTGKLTFSQFLQRYHETFIRLAVIAFI